MSLFMPYGKLETKLKALETLQMVSDIYAIFYHLYSTLPVLRLIGNAQLEINRSPFKSSRDWRRGRYGTWEVQEET